MSGGRRKSKHPQKWEEFECEVSKSKFQGDKYEDSRNCADNAFEYIDGTNVLQKQVRNENLRSRTVEKHSDDSSDDEDLGNSNGANAADDEMSILDVLQGSRQGLLAECKACCIQLRDWSSAINHIQSHRLVFIPDCAKICENVKANKVVGASCLLCQKVCQNLSDLVFHVHSEHSISRKPLMCPFCGRIFSSISILQQHIDIRDVCMKCPVCSATYNQEYELYAHISECLPTFHPHLRSLICHVCDHKINMNCLADHLINHSLAGEVAKSNETKRNLKKTSIVSVSQAENYDIRTKMFLCEICDRRLSSLNKFQTHLNDHAQTKMYCPLCFLKGFEKIECMVRHLMMRCPRRTNEQLEFGNIISAIGKEHKLNFVEVLRKFEKVKPFKDGLLTWSSIPVVEDAIKSFEISSILKDKPRSEPTDIELLLWLNQIENEPDTKRTTLNDCSSSLEEMVKNYPGIKILRGVNLNRLKHLQNEAKALEEKDFLSTAIEKEKFPANTFLRLEWEAQYLRHKEPFYVRETEDKLRFSPITPKPKQKSIPCDVSPQILKKLKGELEALRANASERNQNISFDKIRLNKLLLEAKDG